MIQLLTPDEINRLKKAVGSDLDLLLYLGEWLVHLNLFSDAQIYDILRFVKDAVTTLESNLESDKIVLAFCGIAESRWVSFTDVNGYWDVQKAERVEVLDSIAVTHIFCDMLGLKHRILQRQGRNNGTVTTPNQASG